MRFFTTKEVAGLVGVHPQTLRSWERTGVIPMATRRRGLRVYTAADVEQIKMAVFDPPPADSVGDETR
jgi:DNA-binding transcriptional MerR regulator